MADPFPLIPNVGIREDWEWKTDVLRTVNGTEQRLSLRSRPRIETTAEFGPLSFSQQKTFKDLLRQNIKNAFDTPLWQYVAPITQETASGNSRVYFDPTLVPVTDGGLIVFINQWTEEAFSGTVDTVETDGATLDANISTTIGTSWVVCLAHSALIRDDKGTLRSGSNSAVFSVVHQGIGFIPVERQDASVTLTTLDGDPVLERRAIDVNEDNWTFRKKLIDFDGRYTFASREKWAGFTGKREFIFDRVLNTADMDYWRAFLDAVKGAWKPFYLSTYLPDYTITSGVGNNSGTIFTTDLMLEDEDSAWNNIALHYADGTSSYHSVVQVTGSPNAFNVTPNLPNPVGTLERCSILLKCRMADRVQIQHGALRSSISFDITVVED